MRVFVAGATGAVGARLVPALRAAGHEVVAMTRSPEKEAGLRAAGAEPIVADALDRDAVVRAVERAAPEVVIHQLTALSRLKSFRHFDREFARTNELRTRGTEYLLEGARTAGARRFVAQSYGSWIYEPTGTELKTEPDRLDPEPPANQRLSLQAIQTLERLVTSSAGIDGIALRYGSFYGPGTGIEVGGEIAAMLEKRLLPVIGSGDGYWSFIHVDDAASAAVAAIGRGAPGVYNICDDEPAPVREWLPELARALGAKPPRHLPTWLGRLAVGEVGVSLMTRIRGMANEKAKAELAWRPRWPSWREGFRSGL